MLIMTPTRQKTQEKSRELLMENLNSLIKLICWSALDDTRFYHFRLKWQVCP